jgi:hypothetical protein
MGLLLLNDVTTTIEPEGPVYTPPERVIVVLNESRLMIVYEDRLIVASGDNE